MTAGVVSDIWRFPVKSFGGERLRRVFCGPFGLIGDRRHALLDETGTPLTARRIHGLLGYRAGYAEQAAAEGLEIRGPDGAGRRWDDPALVAEVEGLAGRPVEAATSPAGFHDAASVHLLGEASLAALDGAVGTELDRRRFRANLVVATEGDAPFAEDAWVGRALAVGDAVVLQVIVPTERCAVTTFDPETLERDGRVLATLAARRENLFGVYAHVLRPGWIATGDPVRPAGSG
ncbi:MAG TPA: MOSC domain-containing protein [Miltoncostaeaceae bacterium]|nr:MOSC domain-containing protein [Miltoncostaeaceae bacterium]